MWFIVVGVVVVLIVLVFVRTQSIVKRHSITLSQITGIPADTIAHEMKNGNLTPGQWAAQHGLDPITFRPRS